MRTSWLTFSKICCSYFQASEESPQHYVWFLSFLERATLQNEGDIGRGAWGGGFKGPVRHGGAEAGQVWPKPDGECLGEGAAVPAGHCRLPHDRGGGSFPQGGGRVLCQVLAYLCTLCVQALMLALHVLYQISSGECVRVLQWGQGLHCDAPPCACLLPGSLLQETFSFKWYRENKWQKHFPGKQLKSFYISEEKTFPELDQFLASSIAAYNLHNSVFQGKIL